MEIEKLKLDIHSGDSGKILESVDMLFKIGEVESIDYLLGLLDHPNSAIRDAVALTFRRNRFNDAVDPLLNSIKKKENKGCNGTMAYALETLDCSLRLKDLFDILFDDNSYETRCHILRILDEQIFEFTEEDLLEIEFKWYKLRDSWNDFNKIDEQNPRDFDLDRDLIQCFVDGYLVYLGNR
ncbi:hypothetical protein J0A67_13960 [Algoriphagus aestuariicola]|uniref:HEAT repeat domain-containing protein n=1 Tax=Algoriphagus aestuariicola TaxID=1852016 RepID=A0ABS3BWA3_9BACT|nr:hypothetical protein [Algoriphagus aestuariicola]MBN7801974.1 hypothetical protein [Algoriphagus aestuariicola]